MTAPTITTLHLGAGRQSTCISLLIRQGILPKPDIVLFSDTGIEPDEVYQHLDRIQRELYDPIGLELRRVSYGNLGDDILSPHAFATIPAYTLKLTPTTRGFLSWDEPGLGRQQRRCTGRYKIEPLQQEERILLGATIHTPVCTYCDGTGARLAPWNGKLLAELGLNAADVDEDWARPGPCRVCRASGRRRIIGPVPEDAYAEIWIGYDANEAALRINENKYAPYQKAVYPLLDLPRPPERLAEDQRRGRRHSTTGWTLHDVLWYLNKHGWHNTVKSACVPCPNRNNPGWRKLRDTCDCRHHVRNHPERGACLDCDCTRFYSTNWAKAVAFDHQFRTAPGLTSKRFLHEDRVPLDQANLDRLTVAEKANAQSDIFDALYGDDIDDEDWGGCSPHGCSTSRDEVAA